MAMFNLLDQVIQNPAYYKQLSLNEQLITAFDCPLDASREAMWAEHNYFAYVVSGRKNWHIPGKTFELGQGDCIFVKKGAHVIEQIFDNTFCVVMFFVSDRFIADAIREVASEITKDISADILPITAVTTNDNLHAFFNSVVPYFLAEGKVNETLLELKFRELILAVITTVGNEKIASYFRSLLTNTFSQTVGAVMEENFQYNLQMADFAKLSGKSLSAFKRGFQENFHTTPGRWLTDRRLEHSRLLLETSADSVSEVAYSCGFENTSHYSRAFKKKFGQSPQQYRKISSGL